MKVIIIVDMQNDFIDGALGTPEAQSIVPNVVNAINRYASKDTIVLFTKDTHHKNYADTLEGKNLPVPHCIAGTPGHEINEFIYSTYLINEDYYKTLEILPFYAETMKGNIIEKPTFGSIELQNVLYALNDYETVESITLMGVCTGICVLSNAILCKATLPEAQISVLAEACACVTPESHETALKAMQLCQINII